MHSSDKRILTTHVGSLPRSAAVTDVVFLQEKGESPNDAAQIIRSAVDEVVARQVSNGVDVVSDGEMSKISYATYIKDRISGFDGDSDREPPSDLEEFPGNPFQFRAVACHEQGITRTTAFSEQLCSVQIRNIDHHARRKWLRRVHFDVVRAPKWCSGRGGRHGRRRGYIHRRSPVWASSAGRYESSLVEFNGQGLTPWSRRQRAPGRSDRVQSQRS